MGAVCRHIAPCARASGVDTLGSVYGTLMLVHEGAFVGL
jgi:hypothetical protein